MKSKLNSNTSKEVFHPDQLRHLWELNHDADIPDSEIITETFQGGSSWLRESLKK